jgi:hypothetical protein
MMTSISQTIPARASKTAAELEAALNKALQAHPECQGIKVLKFTPLENSQGLANWDAEFAAEPGVAISAECKRVFISAKQGIQKHFDLAGKG